MQLKNNLEKYYKIGLLIGVIIIIVATIIMFTPVIYDIIWGQNIIDAHRSELIGNETNSGIIAQKLLSWEYTNMKAPYSENRILRWIPLLIYNIDNRTRIFIRSDRASWIIHTQLGNCGEHAEYFVTLMNASGFRSRLVIAQGEDHVLAEYFNEAGNKIFVDPSGNIFINDTISYGSKTHWSRVVARDLSGNEEDITKEFITNLSTLNITSNMSHWINNRFTVQINSQLLKNNANVMYKNPLFVAANKYKQNSTFLIDVGSKKEYQLVSVLDFMAFRFEKTEDLDMTKDESKTVNSKDIMKLKYFKITQIGYLILLLLLAAILIYFSNRKTD